MLSIFDNYVSLVKETMSGLLRSNALFLTSQEGYSNNLYGILLINRQNILVFFILSKHDEVVDSRNFQLFLKYLDTQYTQNVKEGLSLKIRDLTSNTDSFVTIIQDISRLCHKGDTYKYFGLNKLLEITEYDTVTQTLMQEKNIWSRCYGKLFVVNGVSSVGKTTLVKNIVDKYGYKAITMDDTIYEMFAEKIVQALPINLRTLSFKDLSALFYVSLGYRIKIHGDESEIREVLVCLKNYSGTLSFPNDEEILQEMCKKIMPEVLSGKSVLMDLVICNNNYIPLLSAFLNHYSFFNLLCYVPLEINLERCIARNKKALDYDPLDSRLPSGVIHQYLEIYKIVKQTPLTLSLREKALNEDLIQQIVEDEKSFIEKVYENEKSEGYIPPQLILDTIRDLKEQQEKVMEFDKTYHVVPKIEADFVLINQSSSTSVNDIPCIDLADGNIVELSYIL